MNEDKKWGISNIDFLDEDYGQIQVASFGVFNYQVIDQEKLNTELTVAKSKDPNMTEEVFLREYVNNAVKDIVGNGYIKKYTSLPIDIDKEKIKEKANELAIDTGVSFIKVDVASIKVTNEYMKKISEIEHAKIMQEIEEKKSPEAPMTKEQNQEALNVPPVVTEGTVENVKHQEEKEEQPKKKNSLIILIPIIIILIVVAILMWI